MDSLSTDQTEPSERALPQRLARTLAPARGKWGDGEGAKYRAHDEAGKRAGEIKGSQQAGAHGPIEIFIAYSHKDDVFRERLGTHLSLLRRQRVIDEWHDRRIGAGREWAGTIDEHVNTAALILLLVSANFLASDYCYDLEMKRALERHDRGDARVIPVILRAADWRGAPFARLQVLPKQGKPVTSWPDEDEAFTDIARGIRDAVEVIQAPAVEPQRTATAPTPVEIFISYSHKDEALREELNTHLNLLKRQGVIKEWHDRRFGAGQEWAGSIDEHVNTAAVILLLVSADFVASDYCYDLEMTRALERHEAGDARVIPVILRPVDWWGAPFAKLQALPEDAKPVTSWSNRDEAFTNIALGIRRAVEESWGR